MPGLLNYQGRTNLDASPFGSLAEYVDGDAIDEAIDRCDQALQGVETSDEVSEASIH